MKSTRNCAMTIARASGIAVGLGCLKIDIDHFLVAMLEYPQSNASAILGAMNVSRENVTEAVAQRYHQRGSLFLIGSIPYSDAAARTIEACKSLSRTHPNMTISSGHLLMTLAESAKPEEVERVATYGVDLTKVSSHASLLQQEEE